MTASASRIETCEPDATSAGTERARPPPANRAAASRTASAAPKGTSGSAIRRDLTTKAVVSPRAVRAMSATTGRDRPIRIGRREAPESERCPRRRIAATTAVDRVERNIDLALVQAWPLSRCSNRLPPSSQGLCDRSTTLRNAPGTGGSLACCASKRARLQKVYRDAVSVTEPLGEETRSENRRRLR